MQKYMPQNKPLQKQIDKKLLLKIFCAKISDTKIFATSFFCIKIFCITIVCVTNICTFIFDTKETTNAEINVHNFVTQKNVDAKFLVAKKTREK